MLLTDLSFVSFLDRFDSGASAAADAASYCQKLAYLLHLTAAIIHHP